MKNIIALLLMVVTLTACTANEDYTIANKKTAVVAILAENKENTNQGSVGTGFLIKENYIITNFHVAGDTNFNLKVAMENNDETYEAELVYGDKDTDVAVIKLKDWEKFKNENPQLTYLDFATSLPKVTETVWAIGHPWGLFYSVSKGIVSTEARKSPSPFPMWWIQTDADIFQGNSGGPLLNEDGKVVGMNSVMLAQEGGSYGFAIPFPLINKVINDLEKYKEVRWSSLGISIDGPRVTIKEISTDSAAKEAGLQVGDKIVSVRTEATLKTPIQTAFDLISYLSILDHETNLQVTVDRDDTLITLDLDPKFKLNTDYAK
jgi:S1-C subfamily serine protease